MWAVARGDEFLHERGRVEAEGQLVRFGCGAGASGVSKRLTPAPQPPMFGLTTTGKRRPSVAGDGLRGVVDDAGLRVGQAELVEERELGGFR